MEDDKSSNSFDLLLGKLFLSTAKTKIDVHGTLTMEFDGEVVGFNVYDAMKYFTDLFYVYSVDILDSLQHRHFNLYFGDKMDTDLSNTLYSKDLEGLEEDYMADGKLQEGCLN